MTGSSPEEDAKRELAEWMTDHGATDIYWEKVNRWDYPTFSTSGTNRPDLLVETKSGETVAIETKDGGDSGNMYRAPPQLQRYWEAAVSGEEVYETFGEAVTPDVFVIATQHAPAGRLFESTHSNDHLQTAADWGSSQIPRNMGQLPQAEYNATKTAVRIMWQYAGEFAGERDSETGIGIGVLLSSRLDGDDEDRPRLLYWLDGQQHWEPL